MNGRFIIYGFALAMLATSFVFAQPIPPSPGPGPQPQVLPFVYATPGDIQAATGITTTTNSSTGAVSVTTALFAATDVGKAIVIIPGAASAPTDQPYAGTISGYTDAKDITVTPAPSYSLAGASAWIRWGHDDSARLNAAFAASHWVMLGCGNYGATSALTMPNSATGQLKLEGCGDRASNVYALAPMTNLIAHGTTQTNGSSIRDITFDGSKLTQAVCFFASVRHLDVGPIECNNAEPDTASSSSANFQIGDGSSNNIENWVNKVYVENNEQIYAGTTDLPAHNFLFDGTDSYGFGLIAKNGYVDQINIASAANNNNIIGAHLYGYAPSNLSSYLATTGYSCNAISDVLDLSIDTTGSTDGWLGAANGCRLIGGFTTYSGGTGNTSNGAHIPTGIADSVVVGFDAQGQTSRATTVLWDSTRQNSTFVGLNPASYGPIRDDLGYNDTPGSAGGFIGGRFNSGTGTDGTVAGNGNQGNGEYAVIPGGYLGNDFSAVGLRCFAVGNPSSSASHPYEHCDYDLYGQTTTNSAVRLTTLGGAAGSNNTMNMQPNSGMVCKIRIVGNEPGANAAAMWDVTNLAASRNASGNVTFSGTPTVTAVWNPGTWTAPTVAADTTNQGINITSGDNTSTNIDWFAHASCDVVVH